MLVIGVAIFFQIIYSTLNRLVRFVIPNKGGEIYRNVLIDKAVNAPRNV